MGSNSSKVVYIGYTNWRNQNIRFGIKEEDRFSSIYLLGKTGTGKSTLIFNMAKQDIENGSGVAILDSHGDLAESLVKIVPEYRKHDLVYFDATDTLNLIAFNPFNQGNLEQKHLLASEIVSLFQRLFKDAWGVRLEYILRYAILTLLDAQESTILDIHPLLTDTSFRRSILAKVKDQTILNFWSNEFDKYTPSQRTEAISTILNKSGVFLADKILTGIVGQKTGISINDIVDNEKILIVNVSKGIVGEQTCTILGSMLTTSIQMAAMRKARFNAADRKPYFYYIDEAQSFISTSFSQMLSECRKYKLGILIAHQFTDQIPTELKEAILGNAGTIITFRLGTKDAALLANEFYPHFKKDDFLDLPRFYIYLRLLIDGVISKAFSAVIQSRSNGF